jgi:hypothetical protein
MKIFLKKLITNKKIVSIVLLTLIVLLSLLPRLWELEKFPSVIVDEPANLRDIDKLLLANQFLPVNYEWGFGQATLVHYPTVLLIKAGVVNKFLALRLVSVILSVLALIPFYFIINRLSNRLIAFCTTLLFSFSYYYLQFSRVGWTNIHAITLGLFLLFCIQTAIIKKASSYYLLSGLFAGLLTYTYRASELFMLGGVMLFFISLFEKKGKFFIKIGKIGIFTLTFFIISFPWLVKIASNWELYDLRARVVSIGNVQLPYHNSYNLSQIAEYQVFMTLRSWLLFLPIDGNAGNIENSRYLPLKYPPISPILIPFFWAGIIIALKRWKECLIWFFILTSGLMLGQILTVDPPNGSRGLIFLPAIYVFIGLSFNYLHEKLKFNRKAKISFVIFSILIAISDFVYYQYWMTWIKV